MSRDLFGDLTESSQFGTVPKVQPRAAASPADPQTSHDAAQAMNAGGKAHSHAVAVARLVRLLPGATACELFAQYEKVRNNGTRWPDLDRYDISRRLPGAEGAGWVTRGPVRVCTVAGTKQTTWWPGKSPDGAADDEPEQTAEAA